MDELKGIIKNINFDAKYSKMLTAIDKNIELAKNYNVTEDWMYENINELFYPVEKI